MFKYFKKKKPENFRRSSRGEDVTFGVLSATRRLCRGFALLTLRRAILVPPLPVGRLDVLKNVTF